MRELREVWAKRTGERWEEETKGMEVRERVYKGRQKGKAYRSRVISFCFEF